MKLIDGKNYITPDGFRELEKELHQLKRVERPEVVNVVSWAAGNGDRSENGDYIYGKKKLREIDKRIRRLSTLLNTAVIIDPKTNQNSKTVQFGATVKVLNEDDIEKLYTIVGVEEIDVKKGKISWRSPLGRALLNKNLGDFVTYRTPQGEKDIEILSFEY